MTDTEASLEALGAGDSEPAPALDLLVGTATVELGEPVEVQCELTVLAENALQRVLDAPTLEDIAPDDVVTVLVEQVEDEQYTQRAVWEKVAEEFGTEKLVSMMCDVVTPAVGQGGQHE